jgi:hypothetical protein
VEDGPATLGKRWRLRCVTARTAWRRVRGDGAAAAARAVRPHAKAAGWAAAPQRRDSPSTPAAYGGNPRSVHALSVIPRSCPEPGLAGRPGAP